MASVGSPDLIRCSGAGACTIRSQARQASLGRCVTITRYWAGITSSRSDVSSQSAIVASRCVMHFDDRTDKTRTSERITR